MGVTYSDGSPTAVVKKYSTASPRRSLRDQLLQPCDVVARQRRPAIVDEEIPFPERHPRRGKAAQRGFQREVPARRAAVQKCLAAGFFS
jgi:hypothetical protein